jgi:hypothetical protein
LCENGHDKEEYVMTGPQSLTQHQQLSIMGCVLGRSLRIEEISPDEAHRELLSIMPAGAINMLLDAWAAAIGQPALVTTTVADITGTPARAFGDWVTDHSAEFQA